MRAADLSAAPKISSREVSARCFLLAFLWQLSTGSRPSLNSPQHLVMGVCVSSPSATRVDPLEGSRAPTNTPEIKPRPPKAFTPTPERSPALRFPSDVVTTGRTPTEWLTPPTEGSVQETGVAPSVDRRPTPGHALQSRVARRAESLEREDQLTFQEPGVAPVSTPTLKEESTTPVSPADRKYSCGVTWSDQDPLSPHPLSETQGSEKFEDDEEETNRKIEEVINEIEDEKDSKAATTTPSPKRKGRKLIVTTTSTGEQNLVVSPALTPLTPHEGSDNIST